MRPASAPSPDEIPKASASGSATSPTSRPGGQVASTDGTCDQSARRGARAPYRLRAPPRQPASGARRLGARCSSARAAGSAPSRPQVSPCDAMSWRRIRAVRPAGGRAPRARSPRRHRAGLASLLHQDPAATEHGELLREVARLDRRWRRAVGARRGRARRAARGCGCGPGARGCGRTRPWPGRGGPARMKVT